MAKTSGTVPSRRTSIGSRRNPETEAAVLAAARALLLDRGYGGFTVEEVARRAGAGKPTIYRWWPTKADLLMAVYGAEAVAAVPAPDLGELVRDLSRYTIDLWRFWRTTPAGAAFRGLIAEAQAGEPAMQALRDNFLPERLDPLLVIFARAVSRGELTAAEAADRAELWVGFSWLRLLTGRIEDDAPLIRRTMKVIAGRG